MNHLSPSVVDDFLNVHLTFCIRLQFIRETSYGRKTKRIDPSLVLGLVVNPRLSSLFFLSLEERRSTPNVGKTQCLVKYIHYFSFVRYGSFLRVYVCVCFSIYTKILKVSKGPQGPIVVSIHRNRILKSFSILHIIG